MRQSVYKYQVAEITSFSVYGVFPRISAKVSYVKQPTDPLYLLLKSPLRAWCANVIFACALFIYFLISTESAFWNVLFSVGLFVHPWNIRKFNKANT